MALLAAAWACVGWPLRAAEPLPGTQPLEREGDIAAQLVEGVDRFLLRQLEQSVATRARHWQRKFDSPAAYVESVEPQRKRLAHLLGLRDERLPVQSLELMSTTSQSALIGRGRGFKVFNVRWPVFRNVHGEGLLLVPDGPPRGLPDVVAIPDADQSPEQLAGLAPGLDADSQIARRLAESGCRVVVPALISRRLEPRAPPGRSGGRLLSNREFVHRSAYELGRHLAGYELQKVLAVLDWLHSDRQSADSPSPRLGVAGYGEGGMLALYVAALDTRVDAALVSGYFGPREAIWQQPIDRNVFGLLELFGDAEIASLVAPRQLHVVALGYPQVELPSQGGAPATLGAVPAADVLREAQRARQLVAGLKRDWLTVHSSPDRVDGAAGNAGAGDAPKGDGDQASGGPIATRDILKSWLAAIKPNATLAAAGPAPELTRPLATEPREPRQIRELDEHNQYLLVESPYVRRQFMNIGLSQFNTPENALSDDGPEAYAKSIERFREIFRHEIVGHFDLPLAPPRPRTRQAYETESWIGYEVELDVFPDVIAYGVLCLPKSIRPGERRPVVVCQHGLEGRPSDIVQGNHPAYHDFAAKLAERGFITFAPQNLYIGGDKFRTLQRKAYPLKKTLFSVIVPQHQQIVNWLKSLPAVDPERIGFYGLSYGGKSAMRIPPLVTDYCLSICSADFNEWVWKNASTRAPYSYVWTGEYEIFEFDLGSTFNYAEMAALIAPRPFMVERGHFDGVAPDERVGYEFAKVRQLYEVKLKLPNHCRLEWFVGPHTINGKGTFEFLHEHLRWPAPQEAVQR